MKNVITTAQLKRGLTGLVLIGAAVAMTRAAVAFECPWSGFATCGTSPSLGTPPPVTATCRANNAEIGRISCTNTYPLITNPKYPPPGPTGTAFATATSTVDVQGKMTCSPQGGTPSYTTYWTVAGGTNADPGPHTASRSCSNGLVSAVQCRGINVPQACPY
jgi:hypothetical protein